MAITTQRVYVAENAAALAPSGSTIPTTRTDIGTVTVPGHRVQFTAAVSGSAAASASAGFNDLLGTDLLTVIDNHITNVIHIDVVGHTVQYNYRVTDVTRGSADEDRFVNDATAQYVITGELEIATS